MAATRLIPMHIQKGRSLSQCLKDRTDYAKNSKKTENGKYISCYECSPESVDLDFAASKGEYALITGRKTRDKDVIAYQIRQSFKPGEVSPEEANQIGYETAMRWTKGKHAFIVSTHTDKDHIHNHIIYNSTTLDASHKFKNFFLSAFAIRKLSDIICLEHGLSVIEARKSSEWKKRTVYPKRKSIRDKIQEDIDTCIEKQPKDLDELIKLLREYGYEIKIGKYISVKGPEQKSFIRLRSLESGYREEELKSILSGEELRTSPQKEKNENTKLDLLIDIQEKVSKGKGPGYERWAKVHNIKQMARTLLFLEENGIRDYSILDKKTQEATERVDNISQKIKGIENRLSEISSLKKHIINYVKTKDVYAEYKNSGYSERFFEANRADILLCKAAKNAFSELEGKIPKIKELNDKFSNLLLEKKSLYTQYKSAQKEMKNLQTAKYNVDHFMENSNRDVREKHKDHNKPSL